jgi:hypothetical protein
MQPSVLRAETMETHQFRWHIGRDAHGIQHREELLACGETLEVRLAAKLSVVNDVSPC